MIHKAIYMMLAGALAGIAIFVGFAANALAAPQKYLTVSSPFIYSGESVVFKTTFPQKAVTAKFILKCSGVDVSSSDGVVCNKAIRVPNGRQFALKMTHSFTFHRWVTGTVSFYDSNYQLMLSDSQTVKVSVKK